MPPRLGKPITLPPPLRTPLHRTHRTLGLSKLGQIHTCSFTLTCKQGVTRNGKLAPQKQNPAFSLPPRDTFTFFFFFFLVCVCVSEAVRNARKSIVESLTNVIAVIHECYLLLPEMFYVRLSMMVLIALSLKTLRLALFIPQLQEPYAAEPH